MKIRAQQQGLAAIEFIIALPVLLLLMAAMADIGHLFIQYNVLNKTVQNGANYAAIRMQEATLLEPTPDVLSVEGDTAKVVVYGTPDTSQPAVMSGLGVDDVMVTINADDIEVKASYQYNAFFSPLPFTDIEVSMPLEATANVLYRN